MLADDPRQSGHYGQVLSHETIQFRSGAWRTTSLTTTTSTAVYGQDFADPFVLRAGDRYYAYSTNRGPWNVPVISSKELQGGWRPVGDALPQLPAWSVRGRVWTQRLSADGLALIGSPVPILTQDRDWERPTMEAPSMVRDGSRLYLFYSAGTWQDSTYAVGYASCSTPAGPCTKAAERPLVSSSTDVSGPGGQEVVQGGDGRAWLVYHAWVLLQGGYPGGRRMLHVSPLRFDASGPVLDSVAPATSLQSQ